MKFSLAAFLINVCSASAIAAETVAIKIDGPAAIGFFPPFTQSELDNDDGSISEGTSHVAFALEDLSQCMTPVKLAIRLETTKDLALIDGRKTSRLHFTSEEGRSVGIILIAPGKAPLVVYASAGPSSLQWLALDAAAKYFNQDKCKRFVD